jgi:tetratricopeptide (TPR) repeat protein
VAPLVAHARQRRFVNLLPDSVIPADERGYGLLLQAVARFALGDTPTTVAVQLRRAAEMGAPQSATQFWLGACWAAEGRDEEALASWEAARASGWPESLLALPSAEALVRLNRLDQAGTLARRASDGYVGRTELLHIAAAADIAAGRYESAADLLRPLLSTNPDDGDTQFLLLHALFGSAVKGAGPGAAPEAQAEWREMAAKYVAAGGRHRAVVEEWLAYLTSSSASP